MCRLCQKNAFYSTELYLDFRVSKVVEHPLELSDLSASTSRSKQFILYLPIHCSCCKLPHRVQPIIFLSLSLLQNEVLLNEIISAISCNVCSEAPRKVQENCLFHRQTFGSATDDSNKNVDTAETFTMIFCGQMKPKTHH